MENFDVFLGFDPFENQNQIRIVKGSGSYRILEEGKCFIQARYLGQWTNEEESSLTTLLAAGLNAAWNQDISEHLNADPEVKSLEDWIHSLDVKQRVIDAEIYNVALTRCYPKKRPDKCLISSPASQG